MAFWSTNFSSDFSLGHCHWGGGGALGAPLGLPDTIFGTPMFHHILPLALWCRPSQTSLWLPDTPHSPLLAPRSIFCGGAPGFTHGIPMYFAKGLQNEMLQKSATAFGSLWQVLSCILYAIWCRDGAWFGTYACIHGLQCLSPPPYTHTCYWPSMCLPFCWPLPPGALHCPQILKTWKLNLKSLQYRDLFL